MASLTALPGALGNSLFDLLCALPAFLGEGGVLVWVSVVLGVAMVLVFRALVDRPRLDAARNALRAALLEMWLFRHDPWVVLWAEGDLARANLRYLGALVLPLAAALLLAAPLLLQAEARWGLQAIMPGKPVLVVAELEPGADLEVQLAWAHGEGAISPPVRQPGRHRVIWRVEPALAGELQLRLQGAAGTETLPLQVGAAGHGIGAVRSKELVAQLLAPRSAGLEPGSVFRRLEVHYPEAPADWIWWLSLTSLAAAWLANLLAEVLRPRKV
ncbi:MAG: hypothetical protein IT369_06515 [Candidatus Latescibacteria bacterium]|nr:hypothetical protein [Candidatus Latescibacterota bacterium]